MQIVVLGPLSACGNVAATRDVLVLPIRVGRAGYQKETNMEHAVSALGAAGVCGALRQAVPSVATNGEMALDCIDTYCTRKGDPPIPRSA